LGVRWRRFNASGALASIAVGNGVYALALVSGGGLQAALAPSWFGFLPVLWAFAAALVAGWLGAWIGPAPADADVQRAFSSAESHRGPSWEQPAARGTIPGSS
jgi:Na+/proline symporter